MKHIGTFFLAILLSFTFTFSAHAGKPFRRVVYFGGNGLNFVTYLGVLSALRDLDQKPDLVFTTCGSGIARTLDLNLGTTAERKKFLQSPDFIDIVRILKPERDFKKAFNTLTVMEGDSNRAYFNRHDTFIPSIYVPGFTTFDKAALARVSAKLKNKKFSANEPTIFNANKVLFGKGLQGQFISGMNTPLYKTYFFTDPVTQKKIQAATKWPAENKFRDNTYLSEKIVVSSELGLVDALITSASDPYAIELTKNKLGTFATGSSLVFPFEFLNDWGDEIIAVNPYDVSSVKFKNTTGKMIWAAFRVDTGSVFNNLVNAGMTKNVRWIEGVDSLKDGDINPTMSMTGAGPKIAGALDRFSIPEIHRRALAQFNHGYNQTLKALKQR